MAVLQWEPFVDVENAATGWLDEDVFNAWVARAVELFSQAAQARVDALAPGETALMQRERQRAYVLAGVAAVGNAYKAIDTPPPADPECATAVLTALNASEEPTEHEPPQGGRYLAAVMPGVYQPARWVDVWRAWLNDAGDVQSESLTRNLDAFVDGENGGAWRRMEGTGPVSSQWQFAAYRYNCGLRPLSDCEGWDTQVNVPALWDFWLWGTVAHSLARRGARAVMADARGYCAVRNVALARRVGLSSSAGGAALLGSAELMLEEARGSGEATFREIGTTIGTIGAAVAIANPILGGVVAGLATIIALLPPAIAHGKDGYGREWPHFQAWRMTGGAGENDRPTHSVPLPPGFTRPPKGTLVVILPREVRDALVRVDGGEWRPAIWRGLLSVGPHFVEGKAQGRAPWGNTIQIRGAGDRVEVQVPESAFTAAAEGPLPDLAPTGDVSVDLETTEEVWAVMDNGVRQRAPFVFRDLALGRHKLALTRAGVELPALRVEVTAAGERVPVLVLKEGVSVRGARVDEAPPPPPPPPPPPSELVHVFVTSEDLGASVHVAGLDAEGVFVTLPRTFDGAPGATLALTLRVPGEADRAQSVTLPTSGGVTVAAPSVKSWASRWAPRAVAVAGVALAGVFVVVVVRELRKPAEIAT